MTTHDLKDLGYLESLVDKLAHRKLLIVGDVGLDEYVVGGVRRISPEAPVPVLEVEQEQNCLGLAANVAANVASLGSDAVLVGVVGLDETADRFRSALRSAGVSPESLIATEERPTTRKLRVMAGQHHIVRVDYEQKQYLSASIEDRLLKRVQDHIKNCDGVVIEDYAKGVLTPSVIESVVRLAHQNNKYVTLDPNRFTAIDYYRGVDFLTPNIDEAMALSDFKLADQRDSSDSLQEIGEALLKKTQSRSVIITRGKQGMSVFTRGSDEVLHVPTFARQVFDVTGAGDTVIATLSLALSAGLDLADACLLSNFAAGIVVAKVGCACPSPQELKAYIHSHHSVH